MNSMLLQDDRTISLNEANEEISPYDASYPARLLNNGIRMNLMLAENAAEKIYRTVIKQVPEIAQLQQATKKGYRLVVDASDSTLKAIDQGKIKLTTSKGKTYAQLLDEHGRYSTKLPIKKEVYLPILKELEEFGVVFHEKQMPYYGYNPDKLTL